MNFKLLGGKESFRYSKKVLLCAQILNPKVFFREFLIVSKPCSHFLMSHYGDILISCFFLSSPGIIEDQTIADKKKKLNKPDIYN
jgi:hypothetical protein